MVYILQFVTPLGNHRHQARYYIGHCRPDRLARRLQEHRSGQGAAITRAAAERGIAIKLVATLPGDRTTERYLKNQKNTPRLIRQMQRGTFALVPGWALA